MSYSRGCPEKYQARGLVFVFVRREQNCVLKKTKQRNEERGVSWNKCTISAQSNREEWCRVEGVREGRPLK